MVVAVEEGIEVVVVVVGAVGVGAVLQHPAQVPLNVEAVGVAADQTTSFITVATPLSAPLPLSIAVLPCHCSSCFTCYLLLPVDCYFASLLLF